MHCKPAVTETLFRQQQSLQKKHRDSVGLQYYYTLVYQGAETTKSAVFLHAMYYYTLVYQGAETINCSTSAYKKYYYTLV